MTILDPTQSYTFSKYFEMHISPQDFAEEFGYTFTRKRLSLPQYQENLDRLQELQERLDEILPYFDLANKTSRREVLISPIILDLVHYTKSEVRIEYQIKVSEQLQGYFDYLIQNTNTLNVGKSNVTYQFQLYLAAFSLNQSGTYSSIVTLT